MSERSWTLMPGTAQGWWSVGFIVAMPILFIIGSSFSSSLYDSAPGGQTILADIAARPLLALTMLAGMLAGISAFIVGLWGIIRKKEKALLVYGSTTIGALLILYLFAELAFPH